MYGTAPVVSNG